MWRQIALMILCSIFVGATAFGDIVIPGADGSDGELHITANTTIDLGLAATGNWDESSLIAGQGVYDSAKWIVVFKYTSVTIEPDIDLSFSNHPAGAPVVWLVQESVTIKGQSSRNGCIYIGAPSRLSPGPGGYPGGSKEKTGFSSTYGYGPGRGTPGSLWGGIQPYTDEECIPLVGGSGAAGSGSNYDGGAGAGAILIAAQDTIILGDEYATDTVISACGNNNGSGGMIRLVANNVSGKGQIAASVDGRVRIEANNYAWTGSLSGALLSVDAPGEPVQLWPTTNAPVIRCVSLAEQTVPEDPHMKIGAADDQDLIINAGAGTYPLLIEAENVPSTATVTVTVTNDRLADASPELIATFVSGDETLSTWSADVPLGEGVSGVVAHVELPEE